MFYTWNVVTSSRLHSSPWCFLSFVFLGVARRLELSPCNTFHHVLRLGWQLCGRRRPQLFKGYYPLQGRHTQGLAVRLAPSPRRRVILRPWARSNLSPPPHPRSAPSSFRPPPLFSPPPLPPLPCSEARRVPGAGHLPHLMTGSPRQGGGRGPLRVSAEAGGVYGVVRLSPPPQPARLLNQPACIPAGLRSGLHWMKRSGDPVGCWC